MQPAIQSSIRAQMLAMRLMCLMALLLSGCSTSNQLHSTTQVLDINLTRHALQASGIAFITPTSVTGQEEDKQALALAFTDALQLARPDLRVMPLPQTLGAINGAGLANEYRQMFEDYGVCRFRDRLPYSRSNTRTQNESELARDEGVHGGFHPGPSRSRVYLA